MARQPPPAAGVAGGPRVSSRAIKPPSRLVEAPEDLRLARAGVSGSGGGGTGAGPGTASRQGGGTKRDAGSSQPKPRSRARVHGGGGSSLPSGGGGMYAPAGYLGGEHAGLFNMNRPFAAPFRGAPPLNPLAAPSWSVPPMSAPSARDAASALDAVSSRWSRAAGGAGAGAGAGAGVGVSVGAGAGALPAAAAAGGGFPSGGNGPSTNGFLWEPITVQDESGAPQTLFEGPAVEDGHGADMPLPPTLDLFDLFAM